METDFQRRVAAYEAGAGYVPPGHSARLTVRRLFASIRVDPMTTVDALRWVVLWATAIAAPLLIARNSGSLLRSVREMGWDDRLPSAMISGGTLWALAVGIGTPLMWIGARQKAQRIRHAALGCSIGLLMGLGPQLFVEGVLVRLFELALDAFVDMVRYLPV